MDPKLHVYPAIVWVLVGWVAAHAALGVVMQLYVLARSLAGRLDATHGNDLGNITVGDDGTGLLTIHIDRFTLGPGETSLDDHDGSAIVVHESADDLYELAAAYVYQHGGDVFLTTFSEMPAGVNCAALLRY